MSMTVKELIERLQLEDENNIVVIASPDGLELHETIKVANINEHKRTVIVTK